MTRGTVQPALALIQPLVCWASPVAQLVKNLPARQETQVRFLGREDPLEMGTVWLRAPTAGALVLTSGL